MVWFSHPSVGLFSICCGEFFGCARAIQFHSREHLCWHDMSCSCCVQCGSNVHPIVFDFNDFPRRRARIVSTLSSDSLANFFIFKFYFLLATSCHCSFSLSSNKHHACNSSSSSCTSSLMSPVSSSTAFRLLFQLTLTQFAMCLVFPQLQQTLVSPLPPFSCPFPPFLPPVFLADSLQRVCLLLPDLLLQRHSVCCGGHTCLLRCDCCGCRGF